MPRLILLRHAKSDRPAGVPDIDRPLNARGFRVAPLMGAFMAEAGLRPDRVVVSPALRTRQTWDAVADSFGNPRAEIAEAIYEAPEEALLAVIRATPEDVSTLLLVGHNPGLQDLAAGLAGHGPAKLRARLSAEFPTMAFAVIDSDGPFAGLGPGAGRLDRFVRPRDLDGDEPA